jgi:hypothetical protein
MYKGYCFSWMDFVFLGDKVLSVQCKRQGIRFAKVFIRYINKIVQSSLWKILMNNILAQMWVQFSGN